jgi:hypothetical protein
MAGQALRIVRGATNGVAMARSDTLNSMISNAWRLTGLGLAIIIGALNLSLIWFAVAALTGEALALWASVAGLKSKHGMKPATTLLPTAAGIGCVCFAIAVERVVPLKSSWIVNWASFSICSLVSCAVFLVCFPALRYLASVSFTKMNSRIQNRLPWQPSKSLQA